MEIRRFGIGHRRREGLAGSTGVTGGAIHADPGGVIAELAFARGARIQPHTNPNMTWFVVIEGGGFVVVGDEEARVAAGEAVLWPPNVLHGAWTEGSEMRAIVVEFASFAPGHVGRLIEGRAVPLPEGSTKPPGEGRLAPRPAPAQDEHRSPEGEPW